MHLLNINTKRYTYCNTTLLVSLIMMNPTLTDVSLNSKKIFNIGASAIFKLLKHNSISNMLYIANNMIEDYGVTLIDDALNCVKYFQQ